MKPNFRKKRSINERTKSPSSHDVIHLIYITSEPLLTYDSYWVFNI